MNPEDQLRSLRDNSRWTFGELQPRATARPAGRRRPWLTLPALVAEIVVIGVVAAAVAGVIAVQNRDVSPGPVAIGPTPSLSPAPDDFVRGRATCTSLLDDETVARLTALGMAPSDGATALPGEQLTPFLEDGIVCRWSGDGMPPVTFAYAPLFEPVATLRKHLLAAGAREVASPFDRISDPASPTGGYVFGERFWVYADGGPMEDIVPEVFARASVTAIAAAGTEAPTADPSEERYRTGASWEGPGSDLTVVYSGGCGEEIRDVTLVAPGQITVHVWSPPTVVECLAMIYVRTSTVPMPAGVGAEGATVTIINDDSRTFWSSVLE